MGASLNVDEVLELAGCDLLTIAPKLLEELQNAEGDVPQKLHIDKAKQSDIKKLTYDEKAYALHLMMMPWLLKSFQKAFVNLQQT